MSSLRKQAFDSASWTIFGYGTSQLLRLGSNLLLTRMLLPEIFGLTALISVYVIGLQMFSDLGIGPSIIKSDRGDDVRYLNTAWTLQVIRGVLLCLCASAGAWPFARFYDEPQLTLLISISSINALISGFNSTKIFTANKHLRLGRLTAIETGSQFISLSVMIVWALLSPTVWAMVIGGIVGSAVKMVLSHTVLEGTQNRLFIDRSMAGALLSFGKWIFLSTIIGFSVNFSDRLIMGKLMSLNDLGVYSIGAMLAKAIEEAYKQLSNKVFFPVLSKLRQQQGEDILPKITKMRSVLLVSFLPLMWILIILAPDIVKFLFDSRYHEAGWVFQVLSIGLLPVIIIGIGPFYLSFGSSKTLLVVVLLRAIFLFSSVLAGYYIADVEGIVIGIAVHNIFYYVMSVYLQNKYKIWNPYLDCVAFASSAIVLGVACILL